MKRAITQAVEWCIENNILKGFLEKNGSEVINMLYGEWKLEEALVVEREEGREEGLEEGRKNGLEEGLEEGRKNGREERDAEIAKNALTKGVSVEFISEITGLSTATIQELAAR
jgi:predicted transposase/invertase (TIGR01784 family)